MRHEERQQGIGNPHSMSTFIHYMFINSNWWCIIETCWDFSQRKLKKENPNPRSVFRFCTMHHIVPSQWFRGIRRRVLNIPSSTFCHNFKQSVVADQKDADDRLHAGRTVIRWTISSTIKYFHLFLTTMINQWDYYWFLSYLYTFKWDYLK